MNASHPPAGRGGILVALLLLPVACAHAPPQAPTPVHSRGPRAPELSDAVTQIMEAHHLPAVGLVVVSATATQALLVLGHRVAGEGAAAELNDAWQLGSVTKTFTALVLDQLLADRPGGWNTTVAEVLGQGALSGAIAPASLRALAEHRAGVLRDPDPAWVASDAELSMSERRRRLALHILEAPRGAEVLSYSNAGYHVLGAVAEALGRDSWEHLVSTRLGLPTARYGETGEPAPHVFRDGRCVPVERLKEDLVYDTFAPAGHVTLDLAALADYLRRNLSSARGDGPFDQQLYAGEPRTRVWFAGAAPGGLGRRLEHVGSNLRNMASVQLWPEANVALAVVTNCAGSPEVDRAVRAIESVVLEHFLPRPSASLLNASWPEVNPPAGAIAPLNASLLDAQVEGEALPLERWSGRVESQAFPGLSGGRQLWWTDARAGERLRLRVPTPPPGRYKLHARMCFAPDYGTVEITTGPGPPKRIVATAASLEWRDVELGEVEVGSAPVWLDVQAVDSAGEGGPRCHLGLDTLRWRPAP